MSCCTTWPTEEDPALHDYYARSLLRPGWGGVVSLKEGEYLAQALGANTGLRRMWQVHKRPAYSLVLLARKALPGDRGAAVREMRRRLVDRQAGPNATALARRNTAKRKASKARHRP